MFANNQELGEQFCFNCIFNLSSQFEPLHERLISQNAIQIDSQNNIYIITQKRIYVMALKRIISSKDWIHRIIDLKELLKIKDQRDKEKEIEKYSIDQITQAFNGTTKSRNGQPQLQFMKFAVTPQNIPILHSSLLTQRLYTLNSNIDLISFRSVKICPLERNLNHLLAVLLNNGDGHIIMYSSKLRSYQVYQNINALLSQNQQNLNSQEEEEVFYHQIDAIQFSQIFQSGLVFDEPYCFFTVIANRTLYIFKIKNSKELQISLFERITLDAKVVHESILIQVCPKTVSHQRGFHIILMDVKGRIYFILIKMSELDLKFVSSSVQTEFEGIGCLGLKWIDSSEHLNCYQEGSMVEENGCNCSIVSQHNSTLYLIRCQQPKNRFQIVKLPTFSRLIEITQKFGCNILFLQNGDGIVFSGSSMCLLKQPDMYSLNGIQSSTNNQLIVIGGQPDVTQQKKGNIIMLSQECTPVQILSDLLLNISKAIKLQHGLPMISYPINFDDLNLFLNCNKNKVEGTINEMIRIGLGLFDPTGFSKSKPMIAERMTDEIRLLRNQITGLFGEDENIIQYLSGIALINILLIEKNKGWKDLYNKIYFSYLERVEELMRVVLGEVRFNQNSVFERIKEVKGKVIDQMEIIHSTISADSHLHESRFKYFIHQQQRQAFQMYFDQLLNKSGLNYQHDLKDLQRCPVCSVKLERNQWTICNNNHKFLRCNVSIIPLNSQKLAKCTNCKFSMIDLSTPDFPLPPQLFLIREQVCPLCSCLIKPVL